jgi:hypothetical protein
MVRFPDGREQGVVVTPDLNTKMMKNIQLEDLQNRFFRFREIASLLQNLPTQHVLALFDLRYRENSSSKRQRDLQALIARELKKRDIAFMLSAYRSQLTTVTTETYPGLERVGRRKLQQFGSLTYAVMEGLSGKTNNSNPKIPSGILYHTDLLRYSKHRLYKISSIKPHTQTTRRRLALLSRDQYANLRIESQPPGATVWIDGTQQGTTPIELRLMVGKREIQVNKSEYQSWRHTLQMRPNLDIALRIKLESISLEKDVSTHNTSKLPKTCPLSLQIACEQWRDCIADNGRKCAELAHRFYTGQGLPQNLPEAMSYYEMACKLNDGWGCRGVGFLYGNGLGVSVDYRRAHTYYSKACELRDAVGCRNLAHLYHFGKGQSQNLQNAKQLYLRACALDQASACAILGWMYESGNLGTKNCLQANALYRRACRLHNRDACSWTCTQDPTP